MVAKGETVVEANKLKALSLFVSKSCRGVSFERSISLYKVVVDDGSALSNIPEVDFQRSESPPMLPRARTFTLSTQNSNRYFSRFRELSKVRHISFDHTFGQLPIAEEELDPDPEKASAEGFVDAKLPPSVLEPAIKTAKPTQSQAKSRLDVILLEQNWSTVYKRLFVVSFVLNLACLVLAAVGHFHYAKTHAALFSVANVLMVVLVRSEVFLRIVFWLAVEILGYRWIPVLVKTSVTAFLQSVGGIHSGCGVSSVMWLVFAIEETLRHRNENSKAILAIAFAILVLLLISCLAAFPLFRHIHHNFFERLHRFAGWSTLILIWAFVICSASYDPATKSYSVRGKQLLQRKELWCTFITTLMIIRPWLFVRRVGVETTIPPAANNSLLNFSGGIKPGILARISRSPLSEWHAFGIISDGKKRHTILAGAVGDFTKGLVENPPTHLWVRTFHFAGLPFLVNMYNRVVLVATGSGICVFLSFLLQPTKADVHVIWIAKSIQKSYGDEIFDTVNKISPHRFTVVDTAISGRPRTKELVVNKAKEWGAEVVIVTSNPSGTNEIVNSCKKAGIPAFGPIWDS
ncbi:hypothetical protein O6H91_23G055400 [Diphasiastrum complanatum]|uniref:Uncharacterized protein n=1 Tax=Diphasiastrum complanatum TaxID=34168 RepID=A0ACC2AB44_DIPCM|nr:hypothetical protein O6H91_23G055400 [Diphasiastrum complanatum]